MIKAIKRLVYKLEEKLPTGVAEFNAWADDILDTYNMPNNDSTKFALATAVMHAKNGCGYFSRDFFGQVLIKGAANQVAHAVMNECKQRQEAKMAEEKAQAELKAEMDAEIAKLESNG